MNKNNRQKDKPSYHQKKDDYDVHESFSRVKKYRGNNDYRTTDSLKTDEYYNHQLINDSHESTPYTHSSVDRNDYYNLDSKIDSLINNNNLAHENLRKELESKINAVEDNAINKSAKERSETIKWVIGIAITVVIAVGCILFVPYKKALNNEKEITVIKTTLEKSVTPSIEKNTKEIESINAEIKEYLNKRPELIAHE